MRSTFEDRPSTSTTDSTLPVQRPHIFLLAGICALFVLVVYVWLISVGTWIEWPGRSNYYDQLATSFGRGQLALDIKPDPALLALPNPYDTDARAGIDYPLDMSLFKGRFYVYFGPVPALLLLLPKLFLAHDIGDQYLVFAFLYGIFVAQALLVLRLWSRFFSDLPLWTLGSSLVLLGLIAPFSWMLGKPTVNEVSIAGGEFFFLVGLYLAMRGLEKAFVGKWELALAGLCWGAAVGCRATQILPVGFMLVMVFLESARRRAPGSPLTKTMGTLMGLWLTVTVTLAGLGWYNWARFGSILETGYTYQLAANMQKYRQVLISPIYGLQNLRNYLLNPPRPIAGFPYIICAAGQQESVVPFLSLPGAYHSERVTGLLYAAPFTLLGIVPAASLLRSRRRNTLKDENPHFFRWIVTILSGTLIVSSAFLLCFFWTAERYFVDFLPSLLLLSTIGFWQLYRQCAPRLRSRIFFDLGIVVLMGFSSVTSMLIALANYPAAFREQLHPEFWRQLILLVHH
jgi:hypothetical protein